MNPFETKEGDIMLVIGGRWPIFGYYPQKKFKYGKWRFAGFSKMYMYVSTDKKLTDMAYELISYKLIDEDGVPVSF